MKDVKIGDYVSFEHSTPNLLFRVLDVDEKEYATYILYYDYEYEDTLWERLSYVEHVFEVKEKEDE